MFRQFKDSSYLNCAEAEQTGGSIVNMVGGAAAGPDEAVLSSVYTDETGPAETAENTAGITAGPADAGPKSESSNYTTALISIINSILSEPNGIELANQVKNELFNLKSNSVISQENT
jgi:hypothetical protein